MKVKTYGSDKPLTVLGFVGTSQGACVVVQRGNRLEALSFTQVAVVSSESEEVENNEGSNGND